MPMIRPAHTLLASALACAVTGPAHAAAPACPSQDFGTFLTAFADDVAVQKAFVATPLRSESLDPTDLEAKPVTKLLSAAQLHFPLLPSTQKQAADGLKIKRSATSPDEMHATLFKPDTDMQVTYVFKQHGCWQLVRIVDESL